MSAAPSKGVEELNILRVIGHPQPPTPVLQTDNSTVEGIIHLRVQPKCTKAMDMRFHWLRDRVVNQKFIGARGRYSGGITGRNITPPPITAK